MKLSTFSIESIKELISGDKGTGPYRKGPQLVELFNEFGIRDIYDWERGGLPEKASRNKYVANTLKKLNGSRELQKLFEKLTDQRNFSGDPDLDQLKFVEDLNTIIKHDGFQFVNSNGKYVISGATIPDEVEVEIHFEDIQGQIIEKIRSARFIIWVAVAWITDKVILRELYKKTKEGLNVQLIISEDKINSDYGINFEKYFVTYRKKPIGKYKNIMHNKFCIIDLRTVIHGSYNWTNKAQWNKETISIDESREIAETFATEFIRLKLL